MHNTLYSDGKDSQCFPGTGDFFNQVLERALLLAPAEEGGIILQNARTKELRVEAFIGVGVQGKKRILSPNPEGSLCAASAAQRLTINVADVSNDKRFHPLSNSPIKSEIVVPIMYSGFCDGFINLESRRLDFFTSDYQRRLEDFAREISSTFHSAIIDRQRYFLERQLDAVREITRFTLYHTDSPSSVFQSILEYCLSLTESDTGGVFILSDDNEYLELLAHKGLKPTNDSIRLARGEGFVWKCLQENKPLNIWNVHEMPGIFKDLSALHINSELAVPLSLNDEVMGVINIESQDFNAFGFDHEQTLVAFAQQAALLIQLTRSKKKWEGSWAIARWGDMSKNLAHRLNNLVGGISVLASRIEISTSDSSTQNNARRIKESSKQALDVVSSYRKRFEWQEDYIDVKSTLMEAVAEIGNSADIRITVETPEDPIVMYLPRQQFRELCRELIGNAIKAIRKSGVIEIALIFRWNVLVLDIMDSGEGFPLENREDLFRMGARGSSEAPGTGYGLWWTQQFLRALGGDINLSNRSNGGAHVRVTIPSRSKE